MRRSCARFKPCIRHQGGHLASCSGNSFAIAPCDPAGQGRRQRLMMQMWAGSVQPRERSCTMRPLRRLIVSVACVLAGSLPAIAVEPDDLPWEDLNNPGIQDTNTGDADPADPIGNLINQTTPDAETAATPSDVDNDRLEALKPLLEPSPAVAAPAATPDAPTAPAPETKTVMKPQPPEPPEPPAIAPLPQAQPAPATAQGQFQPAQSAPAAPAQPAVPLAAPPATAPVPAAIEAPPAQMATPAAPQPAPPATAPAAQPAPDAPATVEAAPPAETPVAAPAPLATPSASQPDPMAVAQPVQPAPAAPPRRGPACGGRDRRGNARGRQDLSAAQALF
jgi:hypothetical protein